jgi:hypothetical protein
VVEGGAPVPEGTRRLLLAASAVARASSPPDPALPPSVTLGREAGPRTVLYVRFDSLPASRSIQSAFLLLEAQPASFSSEDVPLEVWRVNHRWGGSSFGWSEQPGLAPPFARGIGRAQPPAPIRIDVTALVRYAAEHPGRDYGLAIRASDSTDTGLTLSTGADGGRAPRLDVYLAE